jgi:hypothetical protein
MRLSQPRVLPSQLAEIRGLKEKSEGKMQKEEVVETALAVVTSQA